MPRTLRSALAALPFLLAVSCTDAAKAPAEAAMAAAGAAVEQLKGDAARYAPEAAAARKDELVNQVDDAASEARLALDGLKEKVAGLATAAKLPKGIDRAAVEKAQAGIAALEDGWKTFSAQVKDGDYAAATERARALKVQAEDLARSIAGK